MSTSVRVAVEACAWLHQAPTRPGPAVSSRVAGRKRQPLGWEPLTTKIPLPRLLFSHALYLGLVRTLCLNRAHVDNPRSSPHHEILNLITCAWSFLSCNITYSIFWGLAHGHLGRDGGREHHSGSHRLPQGLNAVVQVRHKYRARSFNNIGFFPGFFPSDSLLHCCSPLLRG